MNGVRLVGLCANQLLILEGPDGIRTLVDKIGEIGHSAVLKSDYAPVTKTCMEQLSQITFDLIKSPSTEIKFVSKLIHRNIFKLAMQVIMTEKSDQEMWRQACLGPYYSSTNFQSLQAKLADLMKALLDPKNDQEKSMELLKNIEQWADGLHKNEQALMLEAIKKRSQFSFDVLNWIRDTTVFLVTVSNAPACAQHTQERLRRYALQLISSLFTIPTDFDTIDFIEEFQVPEMLFETAIEAYNQKCENITFLIMQLMIPWVLDAAKTEPTCNVLTQAIYSLTLLSLRINEESKTNAVKDTIRRRLSAGAIPDQNIRNRCADEIWHQAKSLNRIPAFSSSIQLAMKNADHGKVKLLLDAFADILSPQTEQKITD